MRHPKLYIKLKLQFILPVLILLFSVNSLMALEKTSPTQSAELPTYLLEEMDAESNVLALLGDKNKKKKKRKKGDPFAKKNKKKKPNIYSSRPPRTKSRSKLYLHAMSKKKVKKTKQSTFSYTKPRYKLFKGQKKANKKRAKENNGRQRKEQQQ